MKAFSTEQNAMGVISYNEDVLKTMTGMAISRVDGVAGIEGSGNILTRKNLSQINKIFMEDKKVNIDLSIVVEYGLPLRETAQKVQREVREMIGTMTDLNVGAINITVAGLDIKD
ncbi:Asp23/Gls24 family envelope stress response protein [Desulfallas thermosapovorans]|uniref:Putative alkaline shock family protein YloU n=1 Tax=Desulfallas thermosapovorans DSM 6562 TaxID=1121431 RepID=A0A5S4ZRS5_9FIRM|nr:Asp23/Gls24 family envelope stress response protein [Desulfallas thermosapovorans]TYO94722.1 putative alkaline shock family protein YloU [Desulfallas thermosapovorans DSM 6562]